MASENKAKSQLHPLVGRGVHWWKDGAISHQGCILAVVPSNSTMGDLALVEYLEWISGTPTYQCLVPLSVLASVGPDNVQPGWTLYDDLSHMNGYYDAVGKHKKARS